MRKFFFKKNVIPRSSRGIHVLDSPEESRSDFQDFNPGNASHFTGPLRGNDKRALLGALNFYFWGLLLILPFPCHAENNPQAVVRKFIETAKPLFDPAIFSNQPKEEDNFFAKLRKEQKAFLKREQERKRKFLEKLNKKNDEPEQKQKELAKYWREELDRRDEFMSERQEKIEKYMRSKE